MKKNPTVHEEDFSCRVSLYIDYDLYTRIENLSDKLKITKIEMIYDAITAFLDENEKPDSGDKKDLHKKHNHN